MKINRGAVVILTVAGSVGWSVHAALSHTTTDATPWRLGPLERRIETQPVATGVLEDRAGRVLARPVFDRSGPRGRWIIERPYHAALANAGLGRLVLLPYGIQGNVSGVMRSGAESLRPYPQQRPWLRTLIGDPVLTAPPVPVIRTTLDAEYTRAVYNLFAQEDHKASAVVLDAKSGDILVMVDYPGPDVDSSNVPTGRDGLEAGYSVNLPASTMKTLSAAYILVRHPDAAAHAHECTGDRCSMRHGPVRNIEDALNRSCNMWFRLESHQWDRADWLKFLIDTGIQPVDAPGLPAAPLVMVGHTSGVMHWPHAIGQQVWVSMVGLAAAYATVTSLDGRRVNPSVLVNGGVRRGTPDVLAPAVTARIRQMLRSTAQIGTARPVNATYVRADAGGKTGTGQVEGARSDAVFVATAPWNDPRWILAVSIKRGGTGANAARLAGRILNEIMAVPAPRGSH